MLRADENCRMLSLFITNFCDIFKCKSTGEIGHLLTKIFNFVQFNNKKNLLQRKVKYNDETIKIQDG